VKGARGSNFSKSCTSFEVIISQLIQKTLFGRKRLSRWSGGTVPSQRLCARCRRRGLLASSSLLLLQLAVVPPLQLWEFGKVQVSWEGCGVRCGCVRKKERPGRECLPKIFSTVQIYTNGAVKVANQRYNKGRDKFSR
jgi:hypothetical protein